MGRRRGGPSRTGTKKARILKRYVTDEQRNRRPIFIATLRAAATWLFFRVAPPATLRVAMRAGRSLRIKSRYARRYRQSGSDRLEKQPTDRRRNIHVFRGQDTRAWIAHKSARISERCRLETFQRQSYHRQSSRKTAVRS
jgi:hypothetical protein